MSDYFFKEINKCIELDTPTFYIGADDSDSKRMTYCLVTKIKGLVIYLISNQTSDRDRYKQDLDTLSRVFNCPVYKEKISDK